MASRSRRAILSGFDPHFRTWVEQVSCHTHFNDQVAWRRPAFDLRPGPRSHPVNEIVRHLLLTGSVRDECSFLYRLHYMLCSSMGCDIAACKFYRRITLCLRVTGGLHNF